MEPDRLEWNSAMIPTARTWPASPSPNLCSHCRRIPRSFFAKNRKTLTQILPSPDKIRASAIEGCRLCKILFRPKVNNASSRNHSEANDDQNTPSILNANEQAVSPGINTQDEKTTLKTFPNIENNQLVLLGWPSGVIHGVLEFHNVPEEWNEEKLPPSGIQCITDWLNICDGIHVDCVAVGPPFLPTRLIDLGVPEENDSPRLVCLPPSSTQLRYIALSYCWGGSMPEHVKTKTTNLILRTRNGGLPHLPRTLTDAMDITQKLGVRYLWIDVICILQDSVEDWRTESAKMDHVYGHAYCTLSATSSANTASGIETLDLQPGLRADKLLLKFPTEGGGFQRISIAPLPTYWADLERLPLQKRGWAFQERYLSKRVVHYTPSHLLWECNWSRSSNDVPWTFMSKPNVHLRGFPGQGTIDRRRWSKLVQEYSIRCLTKPSDKLPAFAGIASDFQQKVRSPYLAGLWLRDFPEGFDWYASRFHHHGPRLPSRSHSRALHFRAPTWSWASIDGKIGFDGRGGKLDSFNAKYITSDITLSGQEPFGSIQRASITVRGVMRIANIRPSRNDSRNQFFDVDVCSDADMKNCIGALVLDTLTDQTPDLLQEIHCLRLSGKDPASFMIWEVSPRMLEGTGQSSDSDYESPEDHWTRKAMRDLKPLAVALALVPTGKMGEFRRIGLIRYIWDEAITGPERETIILV
ncbi:hypothetical protein FOVG_17007 [Fusarium oxysporum f. sp. pisi HDV247]|uniref:Heterokaryon incompatibility domain-containing protein n=1 Tax=Fusarium oxysporum f. sp. pisi HDV247 TaxID=1080344 RepID=W9NV90_FUSOX|nr:hypothetical protein FOVG_17007 [Fusarium oxysporum f. sp. pisi HDV247]